MRENVAAEKPLILPNAIIVGTPKSGTSSLFRWLADHPQVYASGVKETRFLLDRGDPLFRSACNVHDRGLEGYAAFFPDRAAAAAARIRLEATPHYLYQETARDVLSRWNPPPHVIVLLRQPAARLFSSFQYTQQNLGLLPKHLSFSRFVDSLRRGIRDPSQAPVDGPLVTRELAYSCYVNYLQPWRQVFPLERFHILLFENLVENARDVLRSLAERLDIDPAFYDTYGFPRFNVTVRVRSPFVQRMARRVGRIFPAGGLKRGLKRWYMALQHDRARPSPEDDREFVAELERDFAPFNERLSREFHLDLSPWQRASTRRSATGSGRSMAGSTGR
jgi:hypothetical protein